MSERLPKTRPIAGQTKVYEEVEYELLIEWNETTATVMFYLRPHQDYPDIQPQITRDCLLHTDTHETPSTHTDLPATYTQLIEDTLEKVTQTYSFVPPTQDLTCSMCYPQYGDQILKFTLTLEVR